MSIQIGLFSPDLQPNSWFAQQDVIEAWFDSSLVKIPVPNLAGTGASIAVTPGSAGTVILQGSTGASVGVTGGNADFVGFMGATTGSVTLTGGTTGFLLLQPSTGSSIALTGGNASLVKRYTLAATGSSIAVTGGNGDFADILGAGGANVAVTGGNASFRILQPSTGASVAVTAGQAGTVILQGSTGASIGVTGGTADFAGYMGATTGSVSISGGQAGFVLLAPSTGSSIATTGGQAHFLIAVGATTGAIVVTGGQAGMSVLQPSTGMSIAVTGGFSDFDHIIPTPGVRVLVADIPGGVAVSSGNAILTYIHQEVSGGFERDRRRKQQVQVRVRKPKPLQMSSALGLQYTVEFTSRQLEGFQNNLARALNPKASANVSVCSKPRRTTVRVSAQFEGGLAICKLRSHPTTRMLKGTTRFNLKTTHPIAKASVRVSSQHIPLNRTQFQVATSDPLLEEIVMVVVSIPFERTPYRA